VFCSCAVSLVFFVVSRVCLCLFAFSCGCLSVLCYLLSISCSILNIGLLGPMALSFMCRLFLYNFCMWYFSSVFMCFPLVWFYDAHGVCYTRRSISMSCV
jgi:hypothetical protein